MKTISYLPQRNSLIFSQTRAHVLCLSNNISPDICQLSWEKHGPGNCPNRLSQDSLYFIRKSSDRQQIIFSLFSFCFRYFLCYSIDYQHVIFAMEIYKLSCIRNLSLFTYLYLPSFIIFTSQFSSIFNTWLFQSLRHENK